MRTKRFFTVICGFSIVVVGVFLIEYVIPNDGRIPVKTHDVRPWDYRFQKWYDFTDQLPHAVISMPDRLETQKLLARYHFKQTNSSNHTSPLNMHVTLGWFPMKTVHRDCIVAPGSIEYPEMTLPEHAVLTFDYGIVSSINHQLLGPVNFKVVLKSPHGYDQVVFDKTVQPLIPFEWQYTDSFYKNIYRYFHPRIEDRDSRWENVSIDLEEYTRDPVNITFVASAAGESQVLAFWGQPRIVVPVAHPTKKNVLLIVIDSMRGDHLNTMVCPNLVRWSRDGVVFTNALSNGNTTKLSVCSFLTSRYPFEMPEMAQRYTLSKADKDTYYARHFPTLPSVLKKQGYHTAQIGAVSLFSDDHGESADLGFDESWNLEQSGYSPPQVTETAIDWLEKHGQEPFFIMLNYEGPGWSYCPPLKYLVRSFEMGVPSKGGWWDVIYRGQILYQDAYLSRLRQYLVHRGLNKDTLVIVTSDHGIAMQSHMYDWPTKYGPWKKKRVLFHRSAISITPDDLSVPLIIIDPHHPSAGSLSNESVQLLDVAPTIVSLCGTTPPADFHGNSLVPLLAGKTFNETVSFHQGWSNYGIYSEHRYLYIRNTAPLEGLPRETMIPEEMYDISLDSCCLNNLAVKESARLITMRHQVRAFVHPAQQIRLGFSGEASRRARLSLTVYDPLPRTFSVVLSSNEYRTFDVGTLHKAVLSGTINGRAITPADVIVSRSAIPLETDLALSTDDLDLAGGWPEHFVYLPQPRVVVGIIEKDATITDTKRNGSQQCTAMLEQWDLIH
ncbi:MAG: sulfatase [Endomicrobiales bacterium]